MNTAHGRYQIFGGAPYTSYQGHFLVPVKPEACQLPINQMRAQFMQFIHLGPVDFNTLVFHTGTGEIHKLGFYFNEHIVSIVVLNAMFDNSSTADRFQFDQVRCVCCHDFEKKSVNVKTIVIGTGAQTLQHAGE